MIITINLNKAPQAKPKKNFVLFFNCLNSLKDKQIPYKINTHNKGQQ